MSQIECIDLTKKYNITGEEAFYALDNVSLKIDGGANTSPLQENPAAENPP